MLSAPVGFDKATGRPARRPRRPSESSDASSSQPCGGPAVVGQRAVAIVLFASAFARQDRGGASAEGVLMFGRFPTARPFAAATLCVALAISLAATPVSAADPAP